MYKLEVANFFTCKSLKIVKNIVFLYTVIIKKSNNIYKYYIEYVDIYLTYNKQVL